MKRLSHSGDLARAIILVVQIGDTQPIDCCVSITKSGMQRYRLCNPGWGAPWNRAKMRPRQSNVNLSRRGTHYETH